MLVAGVPKTKQTLSPVPNKVKEGGSLADIDSWTGLLFCLISRPPFLCLSQATVPERHDSMEDVLGTLSKFLISLRLTFPGKKYHRSS